MANHANGGHLPHVVIIGGGYCIQRALAGQPYTPFHYRDKGSLATIGRAAAVADLGWLRLSGFLAWVAWMTVHLFFIVGFRNRMLVMLSWVWSYITFQRGARLITGDTGQLLTRTQAPLAQAGNPTAATSAPTTQDLHTPA
jgi:NADH dehydrogenase